MRCRGCARVAQVLGVLCLLAGALPAVAQSPGSAVVTQYQLQTVEMRLERLERMLESGTLTEMLQMVDQLQAEVRQLRGQLEQTQNDLRTLRALQRDQARGLEERLTSLEGGVVDSWAETPPVSEQPPAALPPMFDALPDRGEQEDYQQAFERLMAGDYDEAILRLEAFMERYPDGMFSANALFWLAEAKYARGDFAGALVDYRAVRDRFPDSDKAPDALLKIGYSHFELGARDAAREALNRVVSDYPGTTLSRLAQDRLRRLDQR